MAGQYGEYESKTPCQRAPWTCNPRKIEMVAWDADDTMWEITPHTIASNVCGPFKKIDDDTVEGYECHSEARQEPEVVYDWKTHQWGGDKKGAEPSVSEIERALLDTLSPKQRRLVELVDQGRLAMSDLSRSEQAVIHAVEKARAQQKLPLGQETKPVPQQPVKQGKKITIKLLPTMRDAIDELEKRNIKLSVISMNTPGSVSRIIKAFELDHKFVDIKDTWENKGKVLAELMAKHKIAPHNTMFVDNTQGHVEAATRECALGLVIGKDIDKPVEVLGWVTND